MKRITIYIPEDYFNFLKSQSETGTLAEHIRFALAEYVNKRRQEINKNVSASESTIIEGGELNG